MSLLWLLKEHGQSGRRAGESSHTRGSTPSMGDAVPKVVQMESPLVHLPQPSSPTACTIRVELQTHSWEEWFDTQVGVPWPPPH